jgi:pimeloyl-ACP methyl ester carboxylesterase
MKVSRFLWVIALTLVLSAGLFGQAPQSHWAKYEGSKIHYYDIGDRRSKNALIFVHGWTCNADFCCESYSAFPHYRVIALDLPGHGKSDKPKTAYSMDYFARSIEAVMKAAKVNRAVLVGHSMGTPIARQFYRLYPDKVKGIVIVDGSLVPFFTKEQAEQLMAGFRKDFKSASSQFVGSMIQAIQSDATKKKITDVMLTAPEYVAVSAMEGMMDPGIWTTDKINVPVLAIMAKSPWVGAETEKTIRTIAPDLDFQLWTGVTHFLMMERPKEFNEAVGGFVAKRRLL